MCPNGVILPIKKGQHIGTPPRFSTFQQVIAWSEWKLFSRNMRTVYRPLNQSTQYWNSKRFKISLSKFLFAVFDDKGIESPAKLRFFWIQSVSRMSLEPLYWLGGDERTSSIRIASLTILRVQAVQRLFRTTSHLLVKYREHDCSVIEPNHLRRLAIWRKCH